jgi:hypothetical protein
MRGSRFAYLVTSTLWLRLLLAAALLPLATTARGTAPREYNGFELEPSLVPIDEILRGGPDRDAIPALDRPNYDAAREAGWGDDELVIGVVRGKEARAYPIAILAWHELVND